ncbi:MAG: hypothetical protein DMG40_24190 [Acidobacteria bacterium]|nr:MAG: hypothetical protein DMG40_24190 [Acidobacteriota bacterium]
MKKKSKISTWPLLTIVAAAILALGVIDTLYAQAHQSTPPVQAPASAKPASAVSRSNLAGMVSRQARMYYEGVWGVDSLNVRYTEAGEMIRFSYRVLDPAKAAPLNDKKAEPSLIDPEAGVKLKVPQMEKIGKLRQSSTAIAGKSYWMAFSNSGRRVRPGDRVIIQIGNFRADGLVVE